MFQPVQAMLSRLPPPSHKTHQQPLAGSSAPQQGVAASGSETEVAGEEEESPAGWRKAPSLGQGASKKYPHLSKAVEVSAVPPPPPHPLRPYF